MTYVNNCVLVDMIATQFHTTLCVSPLSTPQQVIELQTLKQYLQI